jgi:phage tail P2-like protein
MSNPTVLPPNATRAERALEQAVQVLPLRVPLQDLWDADRCPAALLPWLAWALSVDDWKAYWPEQVKRARVRVAIDVQRRKGTARSVRQVVQAFGGALVLREWWETEPKGRPHTFDMVLTLSGEGGENATARYVDDVIAEIGRTKPVRSHFSFTQGAQFNGALGIGAGSRVACYRRLNFVEG